MAKPTVVKPVALPLQKQVKLPVIDNPSAPDLYADEVLGYLLANNALRITLASVKTDHTRNPNVNQCVVTSRLVLPLVAAQKLHVMLGNALEKVKTQQADGKTIKVPTLQ